METDVNDGDFQIAGKSCTAYINPMLNLQHGTTPPLCTDQSTLYTTKIGIVLAKNDKNQDFPLGTTIKLNPYPTTKLPTINTINSNVQH